MVKHPEYKTDAAKILKQEGIVGAIEIISKSKGRPYHFTALVTTADKQLILRCTPYEEAIARNDACLKKFSPFGFTPVPLRVGNLSSIFYSFESFVEGRSDADIVDEIFFEKLGALYQKLTADEALPLARMEFSHLESILSGKVPKDLLRLLPQSDYDPFFSHGDLTLNNLKFDPLKNRLYLFDFEHAGLAPRGYDIGFFLFFEGMPAESAFILEKFCKITAQQILSCSLLAGLQRTAKFLGTPKVWQSVLKRTEEIYGTYLSTMRRSS
ncbi:MAG: aminoglycoside phosphotransferase family protein [Chlamydiia bacterium]|nr:aminoglycoside phosphotransferase family protein [Chlamydiia bacterium]